VFENPISFFSQSANFSLDTSILSEIGHRSAPIG